MYSNNLAGQPELLERLCWYCVWWLPSVCSILSFVIKYRAIYHFLLSKYLTDKTSDWKHIWAEYIYIRKFSTDILNDSGIIYQLHNVFYVLIWDMKYQEKQPFIYWLLQTWKDREKQKLKFSVCERNLVDLPTEHFSV